MPLPTSFRTIFPSTVFKRSRIVYSGVYHQTWTNPATIVTNGFSTSHAGAVAVGTRDMPNFAGSLVVAGVGINDFSRNVVITVTHGSSVVAMSGTIYGTDIHGDGVEEAWSVTAGSTTKTFTGAKGFKTVTRITETIAADASTNTIIAGNGKVLGLRQRSIAEGTNACVKEIQSGTGVVTNGVYLAASTVSTADKYGSFTPNATLNGTLDWDVWYLVDNID